MSDPLNVGEGEREIVRIFALDLPRDQAKAIANQQKSNGAPPPLAQMLGLDQLDFDHVEVFQARDLTGVGLSGYIIEGLGVDAETVGDDATALDAETGSVVVLHAGAFLGRAVTLEPAAPLRFLGRYTLAEAERTKLAPPSPRSPGSESRDQAPEAVLRPPARGPRTLVLIALLAAALLVLAAAFLFGGPG
ncbi:MAG: hypothetical protein AAF626_13565 [Pseudomonadota bacterium]